MLLNSDRPGGGGGGGVCAAAGAAATTRPETNARLPTCRRMASPYDPLSKKHRYNITSCPVNPAAPIVAAVLLQGGDGLPGTTNRPVLRRRRSRQWRR